MRGASTVEALVVIPIFLFSLLAIVQAAMVFYAKSSVNYATFEAARAGTVNGASVLSINAAFQKGMLPYYGGGTTPAQLADTVARVAADLTDTAVRIELLSPTQESFQDYGSPALKAQLRSDDPVIPNTGLDELTCPRDVPDCKSDPESNASGQTLLDANLLKLRVTYGIPEQKQMPMVGKFYTWALDMMHAGSGDPFKEALIKAGRIPIVTSTVMRMQSDIVRNDAMISSPGHGNDGTPEDPGDPPTGPGLPTCPWWDPACLSCPDGTNTCTPDTCSGGS
jgi:hypothetical protein